MAKQNIAIGKDEYDYMQVKSRGVVVSVTSLLFLEMVQCKWLLFNE